MVHQGGRFTSAARMRNQASAQSAADSSVSFPLSELPDSCFEHILSCLTDPLDVLNVQISCRRWRQLTLHSKVWHELARAQYGLLLQVTASYPKPLSALPSPSPAKHRVVEIGSWLSTGQATAYQSVRGI